MNQKVKRKLIQAIDLYLIEDANLIHIALGISIILKKIDGIHSLNDSLVEFSIWKVIVFL